MSSLSTLPKGDSAWLLRKSIQRIMQQVSVLETNIGSSTTGNSANTQVIFNDNGVLRGDAGLTYNAASDILSFGAGICYGDLTVDTSTLKVDSANNRVGINTASPTVALDVNATQVKIANNATADITVLVGPDTPSAARSGRLGFITSSTQKNWYILNSWNTSGAFEIAQTTAAGGSTLSSNSTFRINSDSSFDFLDGAGGTRMTLNSTGLGLGVSPITKFQISGGSSAVYQTFTNTSGAYQHAYVGNPSNALTFGFSSQNGSFSADEKMRIDTSGNVGVGVTPSAWGSGYTAIQNRQTSWFATSARDANFSANVYVDAVGYKYIATAQSSLYTQYQGAHSWYTAPSGTAGTAITFTQAMTLDASANLLVGVTSALFNSRLRVKTSSTSASDYGVYFADSADALIFALRNDGLIYTGTKTASPYNNTTGSAANAFIAADGTLGRSTSSLKYKTDITDSTRGLADVLKLRPVTYKSKNGDDTIFGGLIAEEVHAAGLTEFVAYAPDNAPDAIHYSNMVSLLVAAIKELTARVQTLETR